MTNCTQTIEYAFKVSNQRGLENRTMTIFKTIFFIAIESVVSVDFSLNLLYQIPVCINCISKKNIHDIVSQNLKSFMCLFYWHAVSQLNTNGNMIEIKQLQMTFTFDVVLFLL